MKSKDIQQVVKNK